MLRTSPLEDQMAVEAHLRSLSARELTRLAQVFTLACGTVCLVPSTIVESVGS